MHNFTGMPIPNATMARLQIAEEAKGIDPNYEVFVAGMLIHHATRPKLAREYLSAIVEDFMQRYPHGRGTTGSKKLRSFYAACYSIKYADSRTRRQKGDDRSKMHAALQKLSKTARTLLLEFTDAPAAFKMNKAALWKLVDANFVDGTFYEDSSAARVWLTDLGIAAQTHAHIAQDRSDKEVRAAAFKPGDTYRNKGDDFFTSGIDIGDHGNAINVYRASEEEAIALRDKVLDLLKRNA
jgi:hypothetical protein